MVRCSISGASVLRTGRVREFNPLAVDAVAEFFVASADIDDPHTTVGAKCSEGQRVQHDGFTGSGGSRHDAVVVAMRISKRINVRDLTSAREQRKDRRRQQMAGTRA